MTKTFGAVIIFFILLLSCISVSHEKAYTAKSHEFLEKEKEFTISADSAARICAAYRFKKEPKLDTVNTFLYIIYKDYYVFADNHRRLNPKTYWYYLPGIWVNGYTGKAKRVKGEKYIQLQVPTDDSCGYFFGLGYYQQQFIRNK